MNSDDILFVSSPTPGRAFFQNVGETRRQGLEAGLNVKAATWSAFVEYALTDATFQTALVLNSPESRSRPRPGRRGERSHLRDARRQASRHPPEFAKGGLQLVCHAGMAGRRYRAGGERQISRRRRVEPQSEDGIHGVVNFNTSYQITKNIQVFGVVENLLNAKYATFGTFSPVTAVPIVQVPGATVTRSLSQAPPFAAYAGVQITF